MKIFFIFLFVFFFTSNIFAISDENRIKFTFNLEQDIIKNLATLNSGKLDNRTFDKIKNLNSSINKISIDFAGANVVFNLSFNSYEISDGDSYMIKRAFTVPYNITLKINKYFLYRIIADNYKITDEDMMNFTTSSPKHLTYVIKNKNEFKFIVEISFTIDVEGLSRGSVYRLISEIDTKPITTLAINSDKNMNQDSDTPGIAAKKAIEESQRLAVIKEQERQKIRDEEEAKRRMELEEKEKEEQEKKRKKEEDKQRRAKALEEAMKKEKEEREKLELEEISAVNDKKEKKPIVSTEDQLKQLLFKRRIKEMEDIAKEREKLVIDKKAVNLVSINLYSLDDKNFAFSDYINKRKGMIIFAWTVPEGIKNDMAYLNEMVYLQTQYKYYQKKNIELISIYIPHEDQNLTDKELDNVKRIIERYRISYPVLIDYGLVFYDKVGLKSLPTTLVINKDLKVEDIYFIFSKANQDILETKINTYLGMKGTEYDKLSERIFTISEKAYIYYKYATLLYKIGDLKAAEQSITKSLYITNNFPYPFNLMVIIYAEKKDYLNASEHFLKAIELDSTQAEFYSNMGYTKLETGQLDDAQNNFQKAISLNSELIQAHYGLALVWQKKQLLPKAITEINISIDLSEKNKNIPQTNKNFWEKFLWFNQQKCIYQERYLILNFAGDETKQTEANNYLTKKLTKQDNCVTCHINDDLKINYITKNKELDAYIKNPENEQILQKIKNKTFVHLPVADNNCMVCHIFNETKDGFMPISSVQDICFKCHKEKATSPREHVHSPAKDGKCMECHDPHSASYSSLLREKLVDLCYKCHKEPDTSDRNHIAFKKGECVDCHLTHSSFNSNLLDDNIAEVCFNCHQPERDLFSKDIKHGPLKEGQCIQCHKIHGNKQAIVNESLCFDCHRKGGFSIQSTTTLTSFRNGDMNLHEKHNGFMLQDKPITCKSCHEFHASDDPSLIRAGIKHNSRWGYTINFEKKENSGKCVVGCHKPREYNRVKPVDPIVWK
ncbi:redoxin domain-containing protein [Candidatus Poribacteria bacterium]|nr:redoxin domain-containing protein [Candidatus Poribacteria bacterium]